MGEMVFIKPEIAFPTQQAVSSMRLKLRWENYLENHPFLPPIMQFDSGRYIVIDGHHRLSLAHLMKKDCLVYVANNASDHISPKDFPAVFETIIEETNYVLGDNFPWATRVSAVLERDNIRSIRDLLSRKNIFDLSDLDRIGFEKNPYQ